MSAYENSIVVTFSNDLSPTRPSLRLSESEIKTDVPVLPTLYVQVPIDRASSHNCRGAKCYYSSHRYRATGVWEIGTRCYKCGFGGCETPNKKQLKCKHVPMTPEGAPAPLGAYATWPAAHADVWAPVPRKCNMCRHIQGTEMTPKQQSCNHMDGYREIEMAPEVHLNGGWIGMPPEGHPGMAEP